LIIFRKNMKYKQKPIKGSKSNSKEKIKGSTKDVSQGSRSTGSFHGSARPGEALRSKQKSTLHAQ
jgi:hypothetical protein